MSGATNPSRPAPILPLDDGTRLLESKAISIYLGETFTATNLTGLDAEDRAAIAMRERGMDLTGVLKSRLDLKYGIRLLSTHTGHRPSQKAAIR